MSDQKDITLDSELTFKNAFMFPIQNEQARVELLWGAMLLLIPFFGWVFNMGHRLEIVHRMIHREPVWIGWKGHHASAFRKGLLTTTVIVVFHLPAAGAVVAWMLTDQVVFLVLAAPLLGIGIYILPGFMTFYAVDFDTSVLLNPAQAVRRVMHAGPLYLKAWAIGLCAVTISFLGLLVFGIGFLVTSVWFWQVAAFSFANSLSNQYGLVNQHEL
jgi:hypothetical protein